jgi:hypothetical protein
MLYRLTQRTQAKNVPLYRVRLFGTLNDCRSEAAGCSDEFLIEDEFGAVIEYRIEP